MASIFLPIFRFKRRRGDDKDLDEDAKKKFLRGRAQLLALHENQPSEGSFKYERFNRLLAKVDSEHKTLSEHVLQRYGTSDFNASMKFNNAAIKIQKCFRGYACRIDKNIRKQYNMQITETVMETVITQVCLWVLGFRRLFAYLLFLLLLLITSYYQTIGSSPAAKDVNWSLLSFFNDDYFDQFEDRATQPIHYFGLLDRLVDQVFDEIDVAKEKYDNSHACHQYFVDWCKDVPDFNLSEWTECRETFHSNSFSDGAYIDGSNRINYGLAIIQTRSEEANCDPSVTRLNPYRNEKFPRPCLTGGGSAKVFKSDV